MGSALLGLATDGTGVELGGDELLVGCDELLRAAEYVELADVLGTAEELPPELLPAPLIPPSKTTKLAVTP